MKVRLQKSIPPQADGSVIRYFEYDSADGALREGQFGVGEIEYAEGSVYRGTLIYSNGKFNKYGFGEQDFTQSKLTTEQVGAPDGLKLYKFVGEYNYTVNDWIFGDGTLYFTDNSGAPKAYARGHFCGLDYRKADCAFMPNSVIPGFENAKRIELNPYRDRFSKMCEYAKTVKRADIALFGDSWFEFYKVGWGSCDSGTYYADTKGKSAADFGIGGTTYAGWAQYIGEFIAAVKCNRAFLNAGYNDIHAGEPVNLIFDAFVATAEILKRNNITVYVNAVCPCPRHADSQSRELELNAKIRDYCDGKSCVYVPCDELLRESQNLGEYFCADGIHLNSRGYAIWSPFFSKYF